KVADLQRRGGGQRRARQRACRHAEAEFAACECHIVSSGTIFGPQRIVTVRPTKRDGGDYAEPVWRRKGALFIHQGVLLIVAVLIVPRRRCFSVMAWHLSRTPHSSLHFVLRRHTWRAARRRAHRRSL